MIESAGLVPRGTTVQADVCVVGAGAAGLPLALSLSGKGLSVVLLDSAATPGTPWEGHCMLLDPCDFERRPHVPHSGWPLSWEGLLPWYARAGAWLEVGRPGAKGLPPGGLLMEGLDARVVDTGRIERLSCTTDVSRRYRARLQAASDVRFLQGARATSVRLHHAGTHAERVLCATAHGHRFEVAARAIVVAAGGVETPRLLLASRDVQLQGIGNAFDQVGRYAQRHLRGLVGVLSMHGREPRGDYVLAPDGVPCRARMALTAAAQRSESLLNASLWLQPAAHADVAQPAPTQAGERTAWLWRLRAAAARRLQHARRWPGWRDGLSRHEVWVQAEQQPLACSRVLVGARADALGVPQARVEWRHCLADVASVHRSLLQLGAELARAGVGSLAIDGDGIQGNALRPGPGDLIGTARMGQDPRTSVVDRDGRVHGVRNLFVAGAAAFPTSGQADPTLTIVALALRMADHLARQLQPRRCETLELYA